MLNYNNRSSKIRERAARGIFTVAALFSLGALLVITIFLLCNGVPFIARTGFGKFVLGAEWRPLADTPSYGILPMIVTSLYVTALAVIFGVIIGLSTAVCLYRFSGIICRPRA